MSNSEYPIPGFRFAVTITGILPVENSSFIEAYGFGAQIEVDQVGSGGQNGFKYPLPSNTSFSNLVLKHGIMPSESPLVDWCMDTVRFGASSGVRTMPLTLHLMNDQGLPARSWNFVDAYPVRYLTSEFKSTDNSVAIETLEFAYKYFEQI